MSSGLANSHEKNSKTSQKRGCGPCIVQQDHPPMKIRWRRMILMRQTGQLCRRLEQRRHMHICPQGTTATCVAPSDIRQARKCILPTRSFQAELGSYRTMLTVIWTYCMATRALEDCPHAERCFVSYLHRPIQAHAALNARNTASVFLIFAV